MRVTTAAFLCATVFFAAPAQAQVAVSDALLQQATLGTNIFDYNLNPQLADAEGNTDPLFRLTRGDSLTHHESPLRLNAGYARVLSLARA